MDLLFRLMMNFVDMDNKITIDLDEIRKLPDNSITDPETIRQIALSKDKSLFLKVKTGYEVFGLYPEAMKVYEIPKYK